MSYITIPEFAKMIGVSRVTVYRKVKSGEISATKVGRAYIIDDKELIKVLKKEINEKDKDYIKKVVKKTIEEYGEALKKLSRE